jgi:hypothetical protein
MKLKFLLACTTKTSSAFMDALHDAAVSYYLSMNTFPMALLLIIYMEIKQSPVH